MSSPRPKLIIILGPTASGKSELAVKLALRFNSEQLKKKFGINGVEIISADSRQVYKGMNIGTGKITKKEMRGIPHHLLDVASPKKKFTVVRYQKLAIKAANKILRKKKIPLLVGGSPFYIYSVTEGWLFPKLKPDWKLRKKLEKKSASELFKILKKLDEKRAKTIETKNKRRLIRAIEICKKLGKVPQIKKTPQFDCLLIGIKKSPQELKILINNRLLKRFNKGMVGEVKNLRKSGLSWKRLEEFGLEYRWIARFLQKKISYSEMVKILQKDIEKFSKRQITWFKSDKRIHWIKNQKDAENLIKKF
ncbi:MAG: tRNA (adenosine(37)-N6)-dimethylallyltransferase MiaA [Candidatus Nealsonbacteria bacterium CG_4_9_14_0_2_um_filter_37_38]|uniref:tRNA dimethylallyltransferase n=1 Tax=Candidatus Nealsonbacteria bacterium CG_4_10_14_0_8_um_filter_37_14 TaxID=1974684 RepID=A0A2M7R5L0_9BACT|nr:MAG: tRNA (adenosine(37)-N6)-dimethylallyltransferase MiaA [Candidatus Nealsonbacteria bacterium CG11_big_fil_rev_8_21_14_0_20_37_68]PIW92249.1 MAG: tRNA (adenosine(37)-N6)-dimethylallyltransferase MiaA [Candidatus Nealsonbacteria bacterium CG_4_8_14_3_um_filter_37_23]PIY88682.1 MAG: tRNA (adenosine(37)-N6)-dimethylallyltransferase MiaA [Candidatus Nealsonbacteria bacterium CG_4_10_14_0_8_um_filter_37_14]PJC51810.1 MAG: tRNA (adenosine(37)-N6)-dimethylallyltransferase MiaA [Candidatus Nealson